MKHYFGETFMFTNEKDGYRNHHGYKVFNSKGENIGLVFSSDDKRTPAYGNLELCIFKEFWNKYGQWHRITSHGCRIPWERLCQILSKNSSYECYID